MAEIETESPETLTELSHRLDKYGHQTIIHDVLFNIILEFPHLSSESWMAHRHELFQNVLDHFMDSIFTECDLVFPIELKKS